MSRRTILLIIAIISIVAGFTCYKNSPANDSNYIKTTATITKINKKNRDYTSITITYNVNDHQFNKKYTKKNGLLPLRQNSTITIYCNKDKPLDFINNDIITISYTFIIIGIILIAILVIDRFSIIKFKIFNRSYT